MRRRPCCRRGIPWDHWPECEPNASSPVRPGRRFERAAARRAASLLFPGSTCLRGRVRSFSLLLFQCRWGPGSRLAANPFRYVRVDQCFVRLQSGVVRHFGIVRVEPRDRKLDVPRDVGVFVFDSRLFSLANRRSSSAGRKRGAIPVPELVIDYVALMAHLPGAYPLYTPPMYPRIPRTVKCIPSSSSRWNAGSAAYPSVRPCPRTWIPHLTGAHSPSVTSSPRSRRSTALA